MMRVLKRLGYEVARQKGSHRIMQGEGLPELLFSFHDDKSIHPRTVRKILMEDAGLTEQQALACL